MNNADYIILGILAFYFWRGWSKGLFRSVLGPVALGICWIYSYVYFQRTQNFMISVGIGVLGPIILNIMFLLLLALFKKSKDKSKEGDRSTGVSYNRFFGGCINMLWMGFLVFLSCLLFVMIPMKMPGLEKVRASIQNSKSFDLVFGERLSFLKSGSKPLDFEDGGQDFSRLEGTEEYSQLMKDARVRALFENPRTKQKILDKDIIGLMSDPLVQDIMKDPELLKQFLLVNKKMIELNQTKNVEE